MSASDYMLKIMDKKYPIIFTEKQGSTGYIDFIEYADVFNPVSIGYDIFNRPFIVIRVLLTKNDGTTEQGMETFFKRFIDGTVWMGCGNYTKCFIYTDGGLDLTQAKFLTELLENKSIELTQQIINDVRICNFNDCCKIELF